MTAAIGRISQNGRWMPGKPAGWMLNRVMLTLPKCGEAKNAAVYAPMA